MASEISSKDAAAIIKAITDSNNKLMRMFEGGGATNSPQAPQRQRRQSNTPEPDKNVKQLGKAQAELAAAVKKLTKLRSEQSDDTEYQRKIIAAAVSEYEIASKKLKRSLEESNQNYNLMNKTLAEKLSEFKVMAKHTHGFSSTLAAAQLNASKLTASLIESHDEISKNTEVYRTYINKLGDSTNGLGKSYLKQMGLWDDVTDSLAENLHPGVFAGLRESMGKAQATITENLGSLSSDDLEKFSVIGTGTDPQAVQAAMDAFIAELKSRGIETGADLTSFNDSLVTVARTLKDQGHQISADLSLGKTLTTAEYANMAREVSKISGSINKSVKELDALSLRANTVAAKGIDPKGQIRDFFNKLITTASGLDGLRKAVSATKNIYDQMQKFNIAQLPAGFMSVQLSSVKLGMSFDETVQFMQDNKRGLAAFGGDLSKMTSGMSSTFEKYGYTMKQASELIGPGVEAAIAAGTNIKDPGALNNFMDKTMNSFKNISGIVNITAKEYLALNKDLTGSQDVQATLLGMDQKRAQAYSAQLVAMRDNYVQMGLSTDQAQEMVKAMAAQKRESVVSKVGNAAKAMVMAQQVGMAPEEAQRIYELGIKTVRNPEQDKELAALMQKSGKLQMEKEQAAGEASTGSGMAFSALAEKLGISGGLKTMQDLGTSAEVAKRAGVDKTGEEARFLGTLSQGNATVSTFGNIINTVSSALENQFVKAILGAGQAVLGFVGAGVMGVLALSAGAAATSLSGLAGVAGVAGGGRGALGRPASLAGGPALAVAGAGAAGFAVGSVLAVPAANWAAQKITGDDRATVGTAMYDAFNSEGKKNADADMTAKIQLGKKKIAAGEAISADMAKTLAASGINIPSTTKVVQPDSIATPASKSSTSPINQTPVSSTTSQTVAAKEDINKTKVKSGIVDDSAKVSDVVAQQLLQSAVSNLGTIITVLQQISDKTLILPPAPPTPGRGIAPLTTAGAALGTR